MRLLAGINYAAGEQDGSDETKQKKSLVINQSRFEVAVGFLPFDLPGQVVGRDAGGLEPVFLGEPGALFIDLFMTVYSRFHVR